MTDTPAQAGRPWPPDERQRAVDLWYDARSLSVQQIAGEIGRDPESIHRLFHRLRSRGVEIARRPNPRWGWGAAGPPGPPPDVRDVSASPADGTWPAGRWAGQVAWTLEECQQLVELWHAGHDRGEIARRLHRTPAAIRSRIRALRRVGVAIPTRHKGDGGWPGPPPTVSPGALRRVAAARRERNRRPPGQA